MTDDGLPLIAGASGEAVRDLQQRLAAAGYDTGDELGFYGGLTEAAVHRFQDQRRLLVDGECGRDTWSAVIEAGFVLGDRLLYLRRPMLRGDDVTDLQLKLGALGFDADRVDGIFGPRTEQAVRDFQRNTGLTTDGVCGPDVLSSLGRLGAMTEGPGQVAGIRERARLASAPRLLQDRRIAIGSLGGLEVPAVALGRSLQASGAIISVLDHPDRSTQAAEANRFEADLYLGLKISNDGTARASYYETTGFESIGGRRLAELIAREFPIDVLGAVPVPRGMRLPILRETRMPAVVCLLSSAGRVVEHHPELAAALTRAIVAWVEEPFDEPPE